MTRLRWSPGALRRASDRGAPQRDPAPKPPRLVLRFAVTTAVGLALATAGILLFVRHHGTAQAERAVAFHARFVADSILQTELEPTDFTGPVAASRRAELDRLFKARILVHDVVRARLFTADGRITYASDRSLIGTVAPDASSVLTAASGSTVTDVTTAERTDGEQAKVLAVYVPIRFAGREHVGVFELSQDYGPIASAARKAFLPVAGVLQFVLIALYISLFPLLHRVTKRLRRQMREIEHRALHDALTGLPNRVLFRERVGDELAKARRAGSAVSVMLIDLDRFKEVNDTLGHQSGDQLLEEVGGRLRTIVRAGDMVARLGGDEFGVVSPLASDAGSAYALAERVRQRLERPLVVDGVTLSVEASVGIALFPDHGADVETLLRRADVAMYVSKKAHAPKVYTLEHDHHSHERLAIIGELRRAIDDGELVLHYQPRVSLTTGELQGLEALVRWQHPGRGLLPPSDFIPVAEETGLVRRMTRHVVETALLQCRAWREEGLQTRVAVNLSARDLLDFRLPDEISELLVRAGVEPGALELEIGESMMLTDPQRAQAVLSRLRERNVALAIDDFGTGYSSLRYLKRLPVQTVKIDQSFVRQMAADAKDEAIVRSTIDLGHNLGLSVVAEGVEDEETWGRLLALGCDSAQGAYISWPLDATAMTTWLTESGYRLADVDSRRPSGGDRGGNAAVVALASASGAKSPRQGRRRVRLPDARNA